MSTVRMHTEPMVLRMANAVARYIGFGGDDNTMPTAENPAFEPPAERQAPKPNLRLMTSDETGENADTDVNFKWRRHPQLRAYEAPIAPEVRDGRTEAVRGLFAARAGALDVAREHFVIAAGCDDVDVTAVPGFWNLTRGQMQVAVEAYESVGRYRDAAALDAHIATIFRPSLVGSKAQPIVPARPIRKAAST